MTLVTLGVILALDLIAPLFLVFVPLACHSRSFCSLFLLLFIFLHFFLFPYQFINRFGFTQSGGFCEENAPPAMIRGLIMILC